MTFAARSRLWVALSPFGTCDGGGSGVGTWAMAALMVPFARRDAPLPFHSVVVGGSRLRERSDLEDAVRGSVRRRSEGRARPYLRRSTQLVRSPRRPLHVLGQRRHRPGRRRPRREDGPEGGR